MGFYWTGNLDEPVGGSWNRPGGFSWGAMVCIPRLILGLHPSIKFSVFFSSPGAFEALGADAGSRVEFPQFTNWIGYCFSNSRAEIPLWPGPPFSQKTSNNRWPSILIIAGSPKEKSVQSA